MEIEVGEYVRTNNGKIDQIESFDYTLDIYHCKKGMCIDKLNKLGTHLADIVNHSKNKIDLVENEDILKVEFSEEWVEDTDKEAIIIVGQTITIDKIKNDLENGLYKIKSILTREQFNLRKYVF